MSLMDRIAGFFRAAEPVGAFDVREAWGANPIAYQIGKPQWPTRSVATYAKSYNTAPLIYRCVTVTANAIGSAPLRVYRDEGGEPKEQPAHPLRQLMQRPNLGMGEARFLAVVTMTMAVTGFCVVEKERSRAGRVIGLWPLRSDWLKPIPRAFALPDWEYHVPGHNPTILSADDAIVVTYADHPDGRYTGIGPVEIALREVGIADVMTGFTKAFFDGGAMPVYGLVPDKDARMSQDQADALKAKWMQRYGGLNRSVEPAILQGITDVKRLGFDFNELAYPDLRDLADAAICQAFGVSPMLVDAPVGLKHSTYSNKQEARRGFYEDTISPLWARLDDAFTFDLLPEFESRPGYFLGFDTSDLPAFQEDENQTWQRATAALQAGGLTINQFQRSIGMPGFGPAGDVLLHSLATVPMPVREVNGRRGYDGALEAHGVMVREISGAIADGPADAANRRRRELGAGGNEGETFTFRDLITAEARKARPGLVKQAERTVLVPLPVETRAAIAKGARDTIIKLGEKGAPLLRKFWREQGERVIAAASKLDRGPYRMGQASLMWESAITSYRIWRDEDSETVPPLVEHFRDIAAIDWDDEAEQLAEVARRLYVAAGQAAFLAASDQLGMSIDWSLSNPNIGKMLNQLALRIKDVSDTTREDVRRVVGEALDEGVTMQELADRLRGLFTETYRGRAETVARTESQVAYNTASTVGYAESGVVGAAQLMDNPAHTEDYGASDGLSCSDRNGLIVPLERVQRHIEAEHPNGTLAVTPVLSKPLGQE